MSDAGDQQTSWCKNESRLYSTGRVLLNNILLLCEFFFPFKIILSVNVVVVFAYCSTNYLAHTSWQHVDLWLVQHVQSSLRSLQVQSHYFHSFSDNVINELHQRKTCLRAWTKCADSHYPTNSYTYIIYNPGLCSPLINSVVSNDSVSR